MNIYEAKRIEDPNHNTNVEELVKPQKVSVFNKGKCLKSILQIMSVSKQLDKQTASSRNETIQYY